MEYLIYLWEAAYAIVVVTGFAVVMLWAAAKVLQTRENWKRDQ